MSEHPPRESHESSEHLEPIPVPATPPGEQEHSSPNPENGKASSEEIERAKAHLHEKHDHAESSDKKEDSAETDAENATEEKGEESHSDAEKKEKNTSGKDSHEHGHHGHEEKKQSVGSKVFHGLIQTSSLTGAALVSAPVVAIPIGGALALLGHAAIFGSAGPWMMSAGVSMGHLGIAVLPAVLPFGIILASPFLFTLGIPKLVDWVVKIASGGGGGGGHGGTKAHGGGKAHHDDHSHGGGKKGHKGGGGDKHH